MQEIKTILSKYDELAQSGVRMALAIVVNVEQSSYRRSGARMLITEDGQWTGGISGGCLEGDALTKAQQCIYNNEATRIIYDTRQGDPNQIGVGLGCNGLIEVFITPLSKGNNSPITMLKKVVTRRKPSILTTDLQTGATVDITNKTDIAESLRDSMNRVLKSEKSQIIDGVFVEFIAPPISLLIFGYNYDVLPLAQISKTLGWTVTVLANPLKVMKELYLTVDRVVNDIDDLMIDEYTAVLLMSHDLKTDMKNLQLLQNKDLKYIGLLGPKKRKDKIVTDSNARGLIIAEHNLYGPMGLDTGATSPEEIAISILAEIRTVFSHRNGEFLKNRSGSIH